MQLTQHSITVAGVHILDEYGLADMTMRRLAKRLHVAPGALYWHFPNKQALISAISQFILSEVVGPPTPLDKDAEPTKADADEAASTREDAVPPAELCATIRTLMLAHRDGAELVNAALSDNGLRETLEGHITRALVHSFNAPITTFTGNRCDDIASFCHGRNYERTVRITAHAGHQSGWGGC